MIVGLRVHPCVPKTARRHEVVRERAETQKTAIDDACICVTGDLDFKSGI